MTSFKIWGISLIIAVVSLSCKSTGQSVIQDVTSDSKAAMEKVIVGMHGQEGLDLRRQYDAKIRNKFPQLKNITFSIYLKNKMLVEKSEALLVQKWNPEDFAGGIAKVTMAASMTPGDKSPSVYSSQVHSRKFNSGLELAVGDEILGDGHGFVEFAREGLNWHKSVQVFLARINENQILRNIEFVVVNESKLGSRSAFNLEYLKSWQNLFTQMSITEATTLRKFKSIVFTTKKNDKPIWSRDQVLILYGAYRTSPNEFWAAIQEN